MVLCKRTGRAFRRWHVAGSPISPDVLDRLGEVVDYHGGFLPEHAIQQFATEAGSSPGGMPKAFHRHRARIEVEHPFNLLDAAAASAVTAMAAIDWADGADAFEWLRECCGAPVTRHCFNEALLCNPAFPALRRLREREEVTLKLQVLGQGLRPCDDCAADLVRAAAA
jgi:hypothetical protein